MSIVNTNEHVFQNDLVAIIMKDSCCDHQVFVLLWKMYEIDNILRQLLGTVYVTMLYMAR